MPEVLLRDETGSVAPELLEHMAAAVAHVVTSELAERGAGCEVSLTVANAARIHALNREWREVDRPTDVLSFPAHECLAGVLTEERRGEVALGDIVLCPTEVEGATAEAHERGMVLLAVHGTLHLLGYDHADEADETRMFALQERYTEEVLGR
jgi:probable rRNA maturation factor